MIKRISLDPVQCSLVNSIYNGLERLKERYIDVDKYVLILNVKYYYIPVEKIFGLQVVHKNLSAEATFIITENKNLARLEADEISLHNEYLRQLNL